MPISRVAAVNTLNKFSAGTVAIAWLRRSTATIATRIRWLATTRCTTCLRFALAVFQDAIRVLAIVPLGAGCHRLDGVSLLRLHTRNATSDASAVAGAAIRHTCQAINTTGTITANIANDDAAILRTRSPTATCLAAGFGFPLAVRHDAVGVFTSVTLSAGCHRFSHPTLFRIDTLKTAS